MSTSGPPRRLRVRTFVEQNIVWPILDLRDWLLRRDRKEPPPLYETRHVPLRKKLRWATLDAVDSLRAPVTRRHPRWRLTALRALQIAALPLVLAGAIAFAAAGNDEGTSENRASAVDPAGAPEGPRSGVAGVQDDSEARRERRAERRERAAKRRAAERRRIVRRKRAARRRAIARRRAAERRRARARADDTPSSPSPAVEESAPEPDDAPSAPAPDSGPPPSSSAPAPAPAPSPAPPSPPSGGGGSGGGGGGSNQPEPGVEFDDEG